MGNIKFENWVPGRNFLKYGENKENHTFTIDNTIVIKKKRSQLSAQTFPVEYLLGNSFFDLRMLQIHIALLLFL